MKAYKEANSILAKDYKEYVASKTEIEIFENIDSDYLRMCRKRNATTLINLLKGKKVLMFEKQTEEDCPLHVPLVLDEKKRHMIRKRLIDDMIYCPCHWPIDRNTLYVETELHNKEMSLICDQRYSVIDMKRQANKVIECIELESEC